MREWLFLKFFKVRVTVLMLFIILLVIILGIYVYRNPYLKLYWIMRYPSKIYNSKICTFVSPSGWDVTLRDNDESNKILTMSTGLFDYQDMYFEVCSPYIILYYDKDFDIEKSFEHIMRIIDGVTTYEEQRDINSVKYTIYRYQGNQLLCFDYNSNDNFPFKYEKIENNNAVVIAYYNEHGHYGLFWGLLEQEDDFWDMIASIEWKTRDAGAKGDSIDK